MAYAYQIIDKSVTVPLLKKALWAPAMRFISEQRSANTLTLVGNAFSFGAFVVLALARPLGAPDWVFALPGVLLFLFLSLDNMDGMQARRTGRCTPYGEFLDHWGDTFNMGFSSLGFGLAMELPPWMVLVSLGLAQLTNFAQFWEQRVTGWLRFGYVGGTEGILLLSILYVVVAFVGWETVARTPIFEGVTFVDCFWATAVLGFVSAGLECLARVRRAPTAFTTLTLVVAMELAAALIGRVGLMPAAFTLALAGSLLTGRQIICRIEERPFATFEWPLLLLCAASLGAALVPATPRGLVDALAWAPVAYLALRLALDFIGTTRSLASFLQADELVAVFMRSRHGRGRRGP